MKNKFSSIPEAIEELKKGNMLVVVDDPNRENQGDIILPAATITTEKANFLMKEGRGMFCMPLTRDRATELNIPLMVPLNKNTEKFQCNFGVSIDAHNVTSHGISAADRTLTIRTVLDPNARPDNFLRPGHVSPIIAVDGGVLKRNGHTEAAIDLARLAEFPPVAVLTEIINDQGEATHGEELFKFAEKHQLKIITIKDLIIYLKKNPLPQHPQKPSVSKHSTAKLPTKYGEFTIHVYHSSTDNKEHVALVMGEINHQPVLTRIHSQCLTGDTYSSLRCDCQDQLIKSMQAIQKKRSGVLIYLDQEGRGIGLLNKIKAYELQDKGADTIEANHQLGLPTDTRSYKIAAEILHDLKIDQIILLTNNPQKIDELSQNNIQIVKRLSIEAKPQKHNQKYLHTKKTKLGHLLSNV